ncbi:metalloreductase STEAP3 [Fusarium beomiforme]|uniref:Metalloreductase STEAP3 n=1 Tax=Fusarium beomiforme TaxID=44412 RepID=A0A9P5DT46_9HYPO|nr:metalloreductase STEAP3 [Fusarium beomiforme]
MAVQRASVSRRITLIGSGPVGVSLAKQLVSAGHQVTISNSRGPESLEKQVQETGALAAMTDQAVSKAEVVMLGVPMKSIPSLQSLLRANLRPDAILVDCGNYYPSRDGNIAELDEGMPETVWVSRLVSRPVIKAFNSIIATHIVSNARPKGSPQRSGLPISGDNEEAKALIMGLVEEIGFDAYDAGKLEESWRQQPGEPAYCTEPSLAELPDLLARANHEKAVQNRDQARSILEKLPEDFDSQVLLRVSRLSNGMDRLKIQSYVAIFKLGFALLTSSGKRTNRN